ncbi:MAG: hypothetical protein V4488_04030 [Pseudomonadota bacterium]
MGFKYWGNYAGPGYTGGSYVADGERGDFSKRPIDATDALARAHDWAYANADDAKAAGDMTSYYAIIAAADRALITGLQDRIKTLRDGMATSADPERDHREDVVASNIKTAFQIKDGVINTHPENVNQRGRAQ